MDELWRVPWLDDMRCMLAFEISKILEANNDTVQFRGSFYLPPHIKERMRMLDWTAGVLHIAHFCGIITEQRSE